MLLSETESAAKDKSSILKKENGGIYNTAHCYHFALITAGCQTLPPWLHAGTLGIVRLWLLPHWQLYLQAVQALGQTPTLSCPQCLCLMVQCTLPLVLRVQGFAQSDES